MLVLIILCLCIVFANDKLPFWFLTFYLYFLSLSLSCILQRQIALFDFWHGFFSPRSGNTVGGRLPTETFHLSLSLFLSKFLFSWLSLCIWACIFVLTIADSALLTWLFQSRIHSRGPVSCRKYSTFHCSQPPFLLWSLFSSLFLFFCVLFYGTLRSCLVITHLMFCQTKRCYSLHFSKLLHVFVKAVPHICINCHIHAFVEVVICIFAVT